MENSYEWDKEKEKSNIIKHGTAFSEILSIFDDPNALVFEDSRYDYGEKREIIFGEIFLRELNCTAVFIVVFTVRENKVRIISARRANQRERNRYYAKR